MVETKKVRDLWWEGDTLVVETEDDQVIHFAKAHVTKMTSDFEGTDVVKVEPVDLEVDDVTTE
jgi:hypothetical protein